MCVEKCKDGVRASLSGDAEGITHKRTCYGLNRRKCCGGILSFTYRETDKGTDK